MTHLLVTSQEPTGGPTPWYSRKDGDTTHVQELLQLYHCLCLVHDVKRGLRMNLVSTYALNHHIHMELSHPDYYIVQDRPPLWLMSLVAAGAWIRCVPYRCDLTFALRPSHRAAVHK